MNPADTNHWKNKVDWIFDTWWDKILEPQKKKKKEKKRKHFQKKSPKSEENITVDYLPQCHS